MAKLLTASGKASATRAVELSLLLEDWLSCPCPADGSCGQGLPMCGSHSNPLLSLFCCLIIDVEDQNRKVYVGSVESTSLVTHSTFCPRLPLNSSVFPQFSWSR